MIKDCPKCRRKKVIMGMGAMLKTCPECKGVGHLKVSDTVDFPILPRIDEDKSLKVVNKNGEEICTLNPRTKRPYNRKKVNDEQTRRTTN